jgi:Zn-dependent metalloprotease
MHLPLQAQNIDTITLQKNENGKISYAHVTTNIEMADATNFLKTALQTTSDDSFALEKESIDTLGIKHQRYQQYYKGVKVQDAEYMLHGKNGIIATMNGDFQIVNIESVIPTLSEQQALTDALNYVNAKEYKWQDSASEIFIKQMTNNPNATYFPKGELVIERNYLKGGKNLLLSWKFSIFSLNPINQQLVYVDANTGEIINTTPQILDSNTPLTAQTKYSGTLSITGDSYTGGYRLRETRNSVSIQTLNLQNSYNYPIAIDFTNTNTSFTSGSWSHFTQDQQALDVHWAEENVLDFWRTVFNRNSLDGSGIRILGYVHAGNNWDNAQWVPGSGNHFMQYGDGDGITFNPFTALDVCAHEMGHGINEFTANLTAGNQESGALNEGFSDIWGTSIKHWAAPNKQTWLQGDEILKTTTYDCVRNLQNPKDSRAWEGLHPNTYQGQYWSSTGDAHTNSTVLSHWFYLLSQGGSGTNDLGHTYNVTGIGMTEAEQIAWQTESNYLMSSSDYNDARTLSIQAAIDLFCNNSQEVASVTNAWYAVGVGAQYTGTVPSISGAQYICSVPQTYTLLNQPAGTSKTWSTDNSSDVTINSSGSATRVNNYNGSGFIYATLTGSRGCSTKPSKLVYLGTAVISNTASTYNNDYNHQTNNLYTTNLLHISQSQVVHINVYPSAPGASSYTWSRISGTAPWTQSQGTLTFSLGGTTTGYGTSATFRVTMANTCGNSTFDPSFALTGGSFAIAPNPAGDYVTVSSDDNTDNELIGKSPSKRLFYKIKILDRYGATRKTTEFKQGISSTRISLSGLNSGLYLISVFDGNKWTSKSLVIQK